MVLSDDSKACKHLCREPGENKPVSSFEINPPPEDIPASQGLLITTTRATVMSLNSVEKYSKSSKGGFVYKCFRLIHWHPWKNFFQLKEALQH